MSAWGWFNWNIFSLTEYEMYQALMQKIDYAEEKIKLFVNFLSQLSHLFIFLFKHLGFQNSWPVLQMKVQ